MRRELFICCLFCLSLLTLSAQEIPMQEVAALEQVYGDVQESEGLLPMNELGIEFGYALYEAEITVEDVDPILAVENIRDYASVYVDGRLQGWITDNQKNIKLTVSTGTHHLQLYAENIGRITKQSPCFYRGTFEIETPTDIFLDTSGWGMGEVWINGQYIGSFWENISQRTIPVPAAILAKGINRVVVFELKNNCRQVVRLSEKAIFD